MLKKIFLFRFAYTRAHTCAHTHTNIDAQTHTHGPLADEPRLPPFYC